MTHLQSALQAGNALCSPSQLSAWLEDGQGAVNILLAAAVLAGKLAQQGQHDLLDCVQEKAQACLASTR